MQSTFRLFPDAHFQLEFFTFVDDGTDRGRSQKICRFEKSVKADKFLFPFFQTQTVACFFPDFVVNIENKAFGLFGGEKACDFLFVKEAFQFARFGCEILNKELHFVLSAVCGHGEFFQPDTMTHGKVETGPGADAVEFMIAGATAVAVGTANFVDPFTPLEVIRFIDEYCDRHGMKSVSELTGSLLN